MTSTTTPSSTHLSGLTPATTSSVTAAGVTALGTAGLAALLAGAFAGTYTFGAVNVALPSLSQDLAATPSEQGLVLSAFTTALAAVLILAGRLGDRFGRRRLFAAGLATFTAVSLLAGLAPSIDWVIAARIAQGLALGLLTPQVLSTIQATTTGAGRVRAISLFAAVSGLGTVAGQVIGGALLSANYWGLSWRLTMFSSAVIAVLTLLAVRSVPATRSLSPAAADVSGSVMLSCALIFLVLPLTVGNGLGWPWWVLLLLAIGVGLGVLFFHHEKRLERAEVMPLVPPRMLAIKQLRLGLLMNLVFFTGYGSFIYDFSILTQRGMGYSSLESGSAIICFAVSFVLTSIYITHITARLKHHTMIAGSGIQLISLVLIGLLLYAQGLHVQEWLLQPALIVLGFSQALMLGPLVQTVMSQVPAWAAGLSGGLFGTVQQLGFSLGVAVLGGIYSTVSAMSGMNLGSGFAVAMVLQAATAALFGVAAWRLRQRIHAAH